MLEFSSHPGPRERHLRRRAGNPLFPPARRNVIQIEVNSAQRHDAEEAIAFQTEFSELVRRAMDLSPQEDSEIILRLKEDLDQAYEKCCGLAGERDALKQALTKLISVVMRAVWRGSGDDAAAQANLREEQAARAAHFQMLEEALIADLIRPESPIAHDELAPTLLSETESAVAAAMELFDGDQLALLCETGRGLLASVPPAAVTKNAQARLAQMESALRLRHRGV